jgi:hypothetical protein
MHWSRVLLALAALVPVTVAPTPVQAQHAFAEPGATFDPKIPTPKTLLGWEIGERFTTHRIMTRYLERIAAASDRVTVDTIARSFEGREMFLVTVTSPTNRARLREIMADAQRIADPRTTSGSVVDSAGLAGAISRLPAIVWLGHSVHGGEASGVEAGLALLYQLAAGTDADTRMALDSTVVLIDPNQNPDGRERHTHDVQRWASARSLPNEPGALNNTGTWPGPRTSHYGFDLNRDWFIQSHPESRGRVAAFLRWMPHVTVDLHEQGSSASFYFAPPREPDNKNNPKHLFKWFDIFAAAHGAAFDRHGWPYFRREGYDSFYPGYGEGWPMLTGSIGMLFESASSAGGGVRRNDGTLRTLRQAAWEHYTAEWATVRTAARRRTELVRDYAASRRAAIALHAAGPIRAVVIERDPQGRADSLAGMLRRNGIDVQRLAGEVDLKDATPFGEAAASIVKVRAGSYLVDLAQPQGHLAKALLEPDAELDSAFIRTELELRRTGQGNRFYDITAWSLPMVFRVRAWTTRTLPAGGQPIARGSAGADPGLAPAQNTAQAAGAQSAGTPLARAQFGYVFEPGSEASIRLLASLLEDSIRVRHAPKAFTAGGRRFAGGAFLVGVAANDTSVHGIVSAKAAASGAQVYPIGSAGVEEGTDLGSNSVRPVPRPRVALLSGPPVSGNSWGFAWYALEQRVGYPATLVDAAFVSGPGLDNFSVLVVPSVPAAALDRALGDPGRTRVADWVRNGGVLITIDGATGWLAQESTKLARIRVRRDTTRADSAGGAPLPSGLPGVIARATIDTLSPLLAGVAEREIPVFANSDRVLVVPKDLTAGEAVVRFADAKRVRLAGYFWPEMPERIAASPWLWTERVGRGRIIGFGHDPNFRDLFRGLVPLFANAVLLGGTF